MDAEELRKIAETGLRLARGDSGTAKFRSRDYADAHAEHLELWQKVLEEIKWTRWP